MTTPISSEPRRAPSASSPDDGERRMHFQLAGMRSSAVLGDHDGRMLRCLIVDDNPGFLDAARALLKRQGVTVVGVASNSAQALERADELRPDVTLVDIDLGGESGFDLALQLDRDRTRVILISTHSEQDYAELIAASPAVGFLSKTTLSARAIEHLLAGTGDSSRGDGSPTSVT
jgi:CheY-like chemotaxis protein